MPPGIHVLCVLQGTRLNPVLTFLQLCSVPLREALEESDPVIHVSMLPWMCITVRACLAQKIAALTHERRFSD
ncbi:hypothetical protein EAH75_16880 [Rhodanobacter glycinis]|nr:hypothetical protein EAH75_16880 [Rhodanobacter glycinis]